MGVPSKMIDKGKVSIIIPVYNVEDYLYDCLDSAVNQTYKNIEIILIDDGSTDKSSEICKQYKMKYQTIKYIYQENQGLSSARNTGINACTGEYIFCLDSDDFIARNLIEIMVNEIRDTIDIVSVGFQSISEGRKYRDDKVIKAKFHTTTSKDFYLQTISNHACGKLYKASLFYGVRFPVGQNYEDVATTHKLYNKSNKISYADEGLYYYRVRKGAITQTLTEKNITDYIKSYKSVKSFYPDPHDKEIDYYLMTILYGIYGRIFRSNVSQKKDYFNFVKNEFESFHKVHLRKYRSAPMTFKLILYRLGVASLFMQVMDIQKKIKRRILNRETRFFSD